MPTNKKGLSIKATQPFIDLTLNHATSKKLLTPSPKEHHCKTCQTDHSFLPEPHKYYAKTLLKFHPRKKQAAALCLFHKGSKPSLFVNLQYRKFFCFSCVSGRNIIDFYRRLYAAKTLNKLGGKHE